MIGRKQEYLARAEVTHPCITLPAHSRCIVRQQIDNLSIGRIKIAMVPAHMSGVRMVQVCNHQARIALSRAGTQQGDRVVVAGVHQPQRNSRHERGVMGQYRVQALNVVHQILGAPPVHGGRTMHIHLLGGQPLDTIGNAESAAIGQQGRQGRAHAGVTRRCRCESIVVVRLGKMNQKTLLP